MAWPTTGKRHTPSPKDALVNREWIRTGPRPWAWQCQICGEVTRGIESREEAIEKFEQHKSEAHT